MAGMIVAPEPLAVEAGARVLQAGGNAIDAAVTCAFVQGVVNPQSCGIAGYALLSLHLTSEANSPPAPVVLDGPALAGSLVRPEMWADRFIRANPDGRGHFLHGKPNDVGYTSICTPGTAKALQTMLERWGTITWADAIAPAVKIAEDGFEVDDSLAGWWRTRAASPEASSMLDYVKSNPEARRIYLKPDGEPYDTGERLRNPDYAETLRRLAILQGWHQTSRSSRSGTPSSPSSGSTQERMRRHSALSHLARATGARRLLGRRLPDLQTPLTPLGGP